ncbi:MAG: YifB family Mg chelatase-like AAA ATPase [Marinicella sp.]
MTKLAVVLSRAEFGVQAPQVRVEVHISRGLPGLSIVGMPETAVKESKDRVRAAIMNSGYEFPQHRITINLSPADIPKQGGRYDLPIAVGVLAASGQVQRDRLLDVEFVGELALGGDLRPIRGVLPVVSAVAQTGRSLICPYDNGIEAALVQSCDCMLANNLLEVSAWLDTVDELPRAELDGLDFTNTCPDLADVKGQEHAKRALIIAASGKHNLLFYGPPGTGKTMLASRLPGILPDLTETEALETASVASISAQGFDPACWSQPPFRAPHHTASAPALVGGGSNPMPGEISLAQNGILFLDELPEFSRHVLEVLREPLESGKIIISRAARTAEFPARFQLLASLNPCPCGYFGDPDRTCECSVGQIQNYRNRISGPLLDRIDLQVEVPRIPHKTLRAKTVSNITSQTIKQQVIKSRIIQLQRNHGKSNAQLQGKEIEKYIPLNEELLDFLEQVVDQLRLSARAYHRIIKVSRTIADLDGSELVQQKHLAEAISFRGFDRTS